MFRSTVNLKVSFPCQKSVHVPFINAEKFYHNLRLVQMNANEKQAVLYKC